MKTKINKISELFDSYDKNTYTSLNNKILDLKKRFLYFSRKEMVLSLMFSFMIFVSILFTNIFFLAENQEVSLLYKIYLGTFILLSFILFISSMFFDEDRNLKMIDKEILKELSNLDKIKDTENLLKVLSFLRYNSFNYDLILIDSNDNSYTFMHIVKDFKKDKKYLILNIENQKYLIIDSEIINLKSIHYINTIDFKENGLEFIEMENKLKDYFSLFENFNKENKKRIFTIGTFIDVIPFLLFLTTIITNFHYIDSLNKLNG